MKLFWLFFISERPADVIFAKQFAVWSDGDMITACIGAVDILTIAHIQCDMMEFPLCVVAYQDIARL